MKSCCKDVMPEPKKNPLKKWSNRFLLTLVCVIAVALIYAALSGK